MKTIKVLKKVLICFSFVALFMLQGCESKSSDLPSKYVGTYKDIVQGGQINVGSEKASIKQAVLDSIVIDGVEREFVICSSTNDFYFSYYSDKTFKANVSLEWYEGVESGINTVKLNGKFISGASRKYLQFYGFVYDYVGLSIG